MIKNNSDIEEAYKLSREIWERHVRIADLLYKMSKNKNHPIHDISISIAKDISTVTSGLGSIYDQIGKMYHVLEQGSTLEDQNNISKNE